MQGCPGSEGSKSPERIAGDHGWALDPLMHIGHQLIPPDCPLRSSDWSAPCTSWRGLTATHDLNRVDLWSLDIDNDLQQSKILEQIDWDEFDPVVIVLECKRQLGCETVLQKRGYHTLVLENNQKRTEAKTIKADDEAAFPGGLVPKAMPARRMQGKVRTRRR